MFNLFLVLVRAGPFQSTEMTEWFNAGYWLSTGSEAWRRSTLHDPRWEPAVLLAVTDDLSYWLTLCMSCIPWAITGAWLTVVCRDVTRHVAPKSALNDDP